MLTKNFYAWLKAALFKTSAAFIQPNGAEVTTSLRSEEAPFEAMNKWSSSQTSVGVSFGTGTTPAAASNYQLESILNSQQIGVSTPSAVSFSRADTYEEYSVSFGVTNKAAEAITISEVGLTTKPYYMANGNQYTYYYALVDRTVLDEPITIPAGQSKQVTYTIRFNYGDAA